jgi:hypothetical protein
MEEPMAERHTNMRRESRSPLCLSIYSSSCCFATRSYAAQKPEATSLSVRREGLEPCMASGTSSRVVSGLEHTSRAAFNRQGQMDVLGGLSDFSLWSGQWIVDFRLVEVSVPWVHWSWRYEDDTTVDGRVGTEHLNYLAFIIVSHSLGAYVVAHEKQARRLSTRMSHRRII